MDDASNPEAGGLERRLATILSADVAAYSRLMAEDEEATLRTFRGHKEVFEQLVAMHRGRVFNTAGDAILAEFGSAVEAVRCATEIQAALRTRNDHLPEDRQVRFRIGVNLGDVMVQGSDLLGDGVNLAARLQGAAEPGGICISGSVYDQIRNKLSLSFKPLGDLSYKNIPQAVRTFAIDGAEGLGPLPAPAPAPRRAGMRRGWPLWPVLAAALLLAAGGGAIWAYSEHRQSEARLAAEKARAEARQVAEMRARAEAERKKALAALPPATPPPRAAPPPVEPMPAPPTPSAPPPSASPPAAARVAAIDTSGIYSGRICYGAIAAEPARCYRAQAVVAHDKISGEWPGRERGVTVYLRGDISRSGDVVIHMHAKRANGARFAAADLLGALRNRQIEASGGFRNGRQVTLDWHKN